MLSHISGYFHPIFERWIKLIDGRIERVCSYTRIFPRLRKRLAILKITDIEVELAERNSWEGGRKEVTKLLELSNEEKKNRHENSGVVHPAISIFQSYNGRAECRRDGRLFAQNLVRVTSCASSTFEIRVTTVLSRSSLRVSLIRSTVQPGTRSSKSPFAQGSINPSPPRMRGKNNARKKEFGFEFERKLREKLLIERIFLN